jgi:flagellar basal body-associated protein FliL
MTKGAQTTQQSTPQPAAPKKGTSGLKIFLGIVGGCLVLLIIVGVVGWFLVKKAAEKAKEEFEKASWELEQTFNEFEEVNTSLNELKTITPTPKEETSPAPGP